ncbi:MAG TPA: DUF1801 domain-containing protein [Jiangellales bacterium]|nr:DUF1801 domain-containing protein [Jiangellales bacterium]
MATDEVADDVRDWLSRLGLEARSEAARLVEVVVTAEPRVQQAVKWGRLTFTVRDDWHHWLCAVAVTRKGTKLVFHKGALLRDPGGVLKGTGRYLREVPYAGVENSRDAVAALVREAVRRQTDMLD